MNGERWDHRIQCPNFLHSISLFPKWNWKLWNFKRSSLNQCLNDEMEEVCLVWDQVKIKSSGSACGISSDQIWSNQDSHFHIRNEIIFVKIRRWNWPELEQLEKRSITSMVHHVVVMRILRGNINVAVPADNWKLWTTFLTFLHIFHTITSHMLGIWHVHYQCEDCPCVWQILMTRVLSILSNYTCIVQHCRCQSESQWSDHWSLQRVIVCHGWSPTIIQPLLLQLSMYNNIFMCLVCLRETFFPSCLRKPY